MTARRDSQCVPTIKRSLATASALALGVTVSALATAVLSSTAHAKPEFSQQTGYPCGQCHSNPAGGGKLKAYGEKFKANGFKK